MESTNRDEVSQPQTGGDTFTITQGHGTSDPIPWNASAEEVQAAFVQAAERNGCPNKYVVDQRRVNRMGATITYEQGGADFVFVGKKTKAALKKAIKDNPSEVYLYSTSAFGGWKGYASELPEYMCFNVVGPDPYQERNWYASVQHTTKGNLTVK